MSLRIASTSPGQCYVNSSALEKTLVIMHGYITWFGKGFITWPQQNKTKDNHVHIIPNIYFIGPVVIDVYGDGVVFLVMSSPWLMVTVVQIQWWCDCTVTSPIHILDKLFGFISWIALFIAFQQDDSLSVCWLWPRSVPSTYRSRWNEAISAWCRSKSLK